VLLFAPKWAPEVLAASVTGMCKEENTAMPTTGQTRPKTWLGPQHGPEHEIVLKHQVPDSVVAVPARSELKLLLDYYDQKPRFSLMIAITVCFCMASSYTIGTPCVERQDEAFFLQPLAFFSSWNKKTSGEDYFNLA
jgi:hypothetical protein